MIPHGLVVYEVGGGTVKGENPQGIGVENAGKVASPTYLLDIQWLLC